MIIGCPLDRHADRVDEPHEVGRIGIAAYGASLLSIGQDFGFLGQILAIDQPASSALTRERFAWQPVQPGLIEDLDKGHYFG